MFDKRLRALPLLADRMPKVTHGLLQVQPGRRLPQPEVIVRAGPARAGGCSHRARPYRMAMHGARQFVQVRLGFDEDVLTSALQERPGSLGATMHMGGVMLVDPLPAATAMARWRLYLEKRAPRHLQIQ